MGIFGKGGKEAQTNGLECSRFKIGGLRALDTGDPVADDAIQNLGAVAQKRLPGLRGNGRPETQPDQPPQS